LWYQFEPSFGRALPDVEHLRCISRLSFGVGFETIKAVSEKYSGVVSGEKCLITEARHECDSGITFDINPFWHQSSNRSLFQESARR
jgi:hypothetical protein